MEDRDPGRQAAFKAVQDMLDLYFHIMKKENYDGYDLELMRNIRLIDAWPEGKVEWELYITPFYANLNGVMHGGAAGVIFDMGTTTALCPVQKKGYWDFLGGVTRALNISYLKPIPLNTTVRLQSVVVQHGRTMALIRGTMESVDGKTIYAVCDHHKVNVPTLPEHINLREEMEEQRKDAKANIKAHL